MQLKVSIAFAVAVLFGGSLATAQAPQQPPPAPPVPAQPTEQPQKQGQQPQVMHESDALKDIEATLGFVPQWLRMTSPHLLPGLWLSIKSLQLSTDTKLDRKTKELIGLAVSAQIPCEYCVTFHTEAARMNGATDEEIREAVGMAAVTREASTVLNGMMVDKAQFRRDLDRMRQSKQQARK